MLLSTPVILSPVYLGGFTRSNCMCGPFQLMRELRILIKKLQCRKTFKRLNLLTQRKEKFDGFGTHETLANITVLCRLHSLTFHKLQPCDVATFGLLQTTHRDQANEWSEEVSLLSAKEHFLYLYKSARERAFTPKNTKAGFAASGLFPCNPERVLRIVPKPPTKPHFVVNNEAPCREDEVLQTSVKPVSAEVLCRISLRDLAVCTEKILEHIFFV
jgi:hypothetical protein